MKLEKYDPAIHRELVMKWMREDTDPAHHVMSPDIWEEKNTETLVVSDDEGIVGFVRLRKKGDTLRINFQLDCTQKKRNAKAMMTVFPFLRDMAKNAGYKQIAFTSITEPLIKFCIRRLGFQHEYVKHL